MNAWSYGDSPSTPCGSISKLPWGCNPEKLGVCCVSLNSCLCNFDNILCFSISSISSDSFSVCCSVFSSLFSSLIYIM